MADARDEAASPDWILDEAIEQQDVDVPADDAMDLHPEEGPSSNDVDMHSVGSLEAAQSLGNLEPDAGDCIAELLLTQMGASGRSYRRESRQAARKIVSEMYSPPRVTKLIRELKLKHMMAGFAFDLSMIDEDDGMPWDFSIPAKREKAWKRFTEQKPYVLIGSPACTAFSTWQRLKEAKSDDVEGMRRAKTASIVHLDFVARMYREQAEGGRYFLHEHPLHATSWILKSIEEVMQIPGVQKVHGDQCQFGAEAQSGPMKGSPVKKPSGFMINSPELAKILDVQCKGQGG